MSRVFDPQTIWGGDIVRQGDVQGPVTTTRYDLRGGERETQWRIGRTEPPVWIRQSDGPIEILSRRPHDYESSPARVCFYCGIKKRDHDACQICGARGAPLTHNVCGVCATKR